MATHRVGTYIIFTKGLDVQYTIHPSLTINISTANQRFLAYFQNEYERVSPFKPNKKDHTTINVHIVKKLPAAMEGDLNRHLVFKKLFRYEYVIRGLNTDNVDIFFRDVMAARAYSKIVTLFLQAQIIEPVVYYKFLSRNILFMHSAGVTDGKNGYIFPAYGGTGKTTLTLGLMGEGMHVLGDDLLIVEADKGIVHPYLRPLHVFTYNVKTLRGASIPPKTKAIVKFKDLLRIVLEGTTRQEFLISTRVHADTLYSDFTPGKTVPYRKIAFLKKTGDHEHIVITKKNIRELAEKILESEDLNDSLYDNILDKNDKPAVVELELKVIENVLSNVKQLEFINTRKLDFRNLKTFKEQLTK